MSTLDDITQERQRVAERLARVDAERARLAEQLTELEAAERVLSRLGQPHAQTSQRGRRARKVASGKVTKAAAPRRGRRRVQRGRATATAVTGLSLGDATLRAVSAHGESPSAEQVREYLAREFGTQVRPNHLGMALQRHRRAGRLVQRNGRWSAAAG